MKTDIRVFLLRILILKLRQFLLEVIALSSAESFGFFALEKNTHNLFQQLRYADNRQFLGRKLEQRISVYLPFPLLSFIAPTLVLFGLECQK
jgi:hypothetical protein